MSAPIRADVVGEFLTLRIALVVEGAEPQRKRYGSRLFRPERVTLRYSRGTGEPWAFRGVDVAGPFVKKNGEDAADSHGENLWPQLLADEGPGWLRDLVDAHHPGRVE